MWNKTNGYSLETRARGNHLLHFLPRWGKNWWDLTKKNNKKSTKIFWKGESLRPKRIYWRKNSIQKWYLQVGRCRSTTWETGAEKECQSHQQIRWALSYIYVRVGIFKQNCFSNLLNEFLIFVIISTSLDLFDMKIKLSDPFHETWTN